MDIKLKIPELDALPPEQRETVYRHCIESAEFSRGARRIRIGTLAGAFVGFLVVSNAIVWSGVIKNTTVSGLVAVGLAIGFIALMIFMQIKLFERLTQNLVRNHIAAASGPGNPP